MKYQVYITPNASIQIAEVMSFSSNVSLEAARKLYQEIMQAIYSLEEFPYRFPVDDRFNILNIPEHKIVTSGGRYFALYYVEEDIVHVEQFIDNRKL